MKIDSTKLIKQLETQKELIKKLYDYVQTLNNNFNNSEDYIEALVYINTFDALSLYSEKLANECLNTKVSDIIHKNLINVSSVKSYYDNISLKADFYNDCTSIERRADYYTHYYYTLPERCNIENEELLVVDVLEEPFKYSRSTIVIVAKYLKEVSNKDTIVRDYGGDFADDSVTKLAENVTKYNRTNDECKKDCKKDCKN